MSNKTQLSNNNTKLASLIQTLQGKATGGGGAAVETCSLTITCNDGSYIYWLSATVYRDGKIMTVIPTANETCKTYTLDDVVCGTSMLVMIGGLDFVGFSISGGGERVFPDSGYMYTYYGFIKMPSEAGANVTVTVYNND